MKTIIALHGNPGHPSDWNQFASRVDPQKFHFLAPPIHSEDWDELFLKHPEPLILLAHSAGAFRALRIPRELNHRIERIVFVAPYIEIEKPISRFAKVLLRLPILGDFLLKSNHRNSVAKFIDDLTAPQNHHPHRSEIADRLKDWKVWKQVAIEKIRMQNEALKNLNQELMKTKPISVLIGDQDQITNNEKQISSLQKFPNVFVRTISDAGHGIPWTHSELILEEVSK